MRTVVRALIAGVLAIVGTGVAAAALVEPALAAQTALAAPVRGQHQESSQANRAIPGGVAVSIDLIGPRRYASPGSTITVEGTITNDTGHRLDGVQVQLMTSESFRNRSDMESFAAGQGAYYGSYILSAVWTRPMLHNGVTLAWTVSFPAAEVGFTGFGVYPIDAIAFSATSGGVTQASARTLLPYWPASGSAGSTASLPQSWTSPGYGRSSTSLSRTLALRTWPPTILPAASRRGDGSPGC